MAETFYRRLIWIDRRLFRMAMTSSLVTTHWGRVPSVHDMYYPASAWLIQLRAYAMPSVPVPPIMLLTDVVSRCRLLAAHGARSCLSVRTQPLTATGAPSQTSTMPWPCHAIPCPSVASGITKMGAIVITGRAHACGVVCHDRDHTTPCRALGSTRGLFM